MYTKINNIEKNIFYERKNGWLLVKQNEEKSISKFSLEYMDFLSKVKTEREFHNMAISFLNKSGFKPLSYFKKISEGDKIYISEHDKTIFAFIIGRNEIETGINIVGAHIDSPRIDIKQNPLYEDNDTGMCYLDTHYYGGIKKYQWLSQPLALHGVVIKKNGQRINIIVGENDNEPVFCITDLLPHLAQNQMKKTLSEAVEGEKLDILVGSIPINDDNLKFKVKANILKILNEKYSITEEDFLSAELEAVPAFKPRELGFDKSMIIGYGQDDRSCAYAALKAFIDSKESDFTSCLILADKEEIGSYGATGMASNMFEYAFSEVILKYYNSYNDIKLKRALKNSWMISADVNSLFDPLYPSVSEKKNTAIINHGTCVTKYTGRGGKSGASDANAEFLAEIRRIFDSNGVIWQTGELGKVDEGGGGTIAHYLARYGMQVVDCGVGVLSMHAPYEIVSKFDLYMTYKAYLCFLKDNNRIK
ncbi:MAG: aminopeptidase [Elusimicrobiales bacterium]|nr:aminopeptidase [Elusimicrobiales bacterium]